MARAVMRVSLVAVGLVWVLAAQTVLAGDAQRYVKPGSQAAAADGLRRADELHAPQPHGADQAPA